MMPIEKIRKKRYLPCLNLIRISASLSVFLFHTYYNMKASYGFFNGFVSQANACMSLFFILSGFSIAYTYESDLSTWEEKKAFYLKRVKSIAPEYVLLLIWCFAVGPNSIYNWIQSVVAAPFDVIPLFTTIDFANFGLHIGTWFIADIVICYSLYPLLKQLLNSKSKTTYIYVLCVLYVIRVLPILFPYVIPGVATSSIYRNVFLRAVEFTMGIVLASIFKMTAIRKKWLFSVLFWMMLFLSVFGLNWLAWETGYLHQALALFIIAAVPAYCLLIFSGAAYQGKVLAAICSTKVIRFLSKNSYDFWLATFFTCAYCEMICTISRSNLERIGLLFAANTCFALILYGLSKLLVFASQKIAAAVGRKTGNKIAKYALALVLAVYFVILGNSFVREISKQSIKSAYDFENAGINTGEVFFTGFHGDEGQFAWVSKSAECMLRCQGERLVIRAKSNAYTNSQEVRISCNEKEIATIYLSDQVETYSIMIPEDCITRTITVGFYASQSFIPSEEIESSTDNRELAFQIYKIAIE